MRFQPLATALGVAGLCALAIVYAVHTPRVLAADAPLSEFSAKRAMAHVRELAREPRPAGSEAHTRAMTYVMSRLAALGMEPRIQATTGVGTRYPVAGRVRNIVARIPGMRPTTQRGAVLLVAHYDGVQAGPAAADDASGVATLLETLRAIRNGPLLPNDVIALFTDSEESGLLGAAAFVREHAWANDVGVVLNFEARGTSGPSLMFETGPANHDVIRFLRSVPGARATSLSTAVYRQLPNDTDLSELAVLNRPAMNFAFIGGVERYHTTQDDVAHLSLGSLQHHGSQALALTRAFGQARLPRPSTAGDGVFFDLPLIGIVLYPESWAMPLALVALVLCVAGLVVVARRDGRAYVAATLGVVLVVVSVVAAMLVGAGVALLLGRVHASLPWGGAPQWRGIYALAVALLTLAIVSGVIALARRSGRVRAVQGGALVTLGILAVYVTAVMPGISFLFTWPVLAMGVAALVTGARPWVALTARWLAIAIVVFLLAPTAYLMVCVALGLDLTGAAVLAFLAAVGGWLILPQLTALSSGWRVAASAAGASAALMIVGVFTVRTNENHPAGSAFVYALDSAAGGAWLTGGATNPWARAWLERQLRAAAADAAAEPPAWLTRSYPARRIVSAPVVSVAAPAASVVRDSSAPDARVVTLRVRAPGARSVQLLAEPDLVHEAHVDEIRIAADRYRSRSGRWSLDYVAPADSGFTVTLALRSRAEHAISVVARYPGIPTGVRVPARPAGVVPIGSGDMTQVHRRIMLPARP